MSGRAMPHRAARPERCACSGWSLVEMLVGTAAGMLLVAAAVGWTIASVRADSRLLAAERLSADLQTATGLIAADLRRAGYWGNAASALQPAMAASAPVNPYAAAAPAAAASDGLAYAYTRDAIENDSLDGNETVGHRLSDGMLKTQLGASGWQALTDPAALRISAFSVEPVSSTVALGELCTAACPASSASSASSAVSAVSADCPPKLAVRSVRITVVGRSATDPSVVQSMTTTTRLRNDTVSGHCID